MSVLLVGPEEKEAIRHAIEAARKMPVPWEAMRAIAAALKPGTHLKLADRAPGVEELRSKYPPHSVMLGTYRVSISFEEQPAGLFRHLSVSSANKGKVPGLEVMTAVAEEFGFSGFPPHRPYQVWSEEFERGHYAINLLEIEPS